MVQILPQVTSINQDIGRGLSQGLAQGGQLAQQLLPLILRQQMNKQALSGLPGYGESPQAIPLEGQEAGQQGEPSFQPSLGRQKLSAAEINRRVQNSLDPEYTRSILKSYNEEIAEEDTERRKALQERLGHELTPSLEAVSARLQADPRIAGITDTQLRADTLAKELNNYTSSLNTFETEASKRPSAFFHNDYKAKIDTLRNQAKRFIDLGQRDEVLGALLKGGWSESEAAKILNPLSSESKAQLDKVGSLFERKEGKVHLQGYENQQKKLDQALEKAIQPGKIDPRNPGVISPGTSLLLVRNELLKQGLDYRKFNAALGRLVQTGKIKLDPQQNREFQLISEDPSRGLSLYEVLFGPT